MVNNEIEGAKLGLALAKEGKAKELQRLSNKINSDQTDFAPVPMGDNVLYYSSTVEGIGKIYRSEKQGSEWSKGVPLVQFKNIKEHIGNCTVTPDGNRVYYSLCSIKEGAVSCQLYGMEKTGGKWGEPEKLPEAINAKKANVTQPSVTVIGDKEYLYFVSNTKGGEGGNDIWLSSRNAKSVGYAFEAPTNLGNSINTSRDEGTPYFSQKENTLYFSSNGHINLGGFDIFKTTNTGNTWGKPENMVEINSSADDLYYSSNESGAYFVSNRLIKGLKNTTSDDDIFSTGQATRSNDKSSSMDKMLIAKMTGKITDIADTLRPLTMVTGTLSEGLDGSYKQIASSLFSSGIYSFDLEPSSDYRIDIQRDGYEPTYIEFNTHDFSESFEFTQDIQMKKIGGKIATIDKPLQTIDPTKPIMDTPKIDSKINISPNTADDGDEEVLDISELTTEQRSKIITMEGQPYIQVGDGYVLVVDRKAKNTKSEPIADTKMPTAPPPTKITTVDIPKKTEPTKIATATPPIKQSPPTKPVKEKTPTTTTVVKETITSTPPSTYIATTAPMGTSYRIQIAAVETDKYKPQKYDNLQSLGGIETEPGPNGLLRVLVMPYTTDYKSLLVQVKRLGYTGAFLAKYSDGRRVN
jgi:hypothetical protein